MATVPPAAKRILRFWEWPFVAALAAFMLWVRLLPYDALVGGQRAYYIGTDPFYHYRAVLGIVDAFPRVPRWDPWTFYPNGTGTGQFSSLFDWVVAFIAIVSSGGDPSDLHVQRVLGAFPAYLGALMVIPFYFLAKRLVGTAGAVVASLTLAVLPGEFLVRSIAGYADHHVAEALMAVVAILGVVVAVERANAKRDSLVDLRDVRAYRGPLAWALLAGVALAAEFYTWPPAILFLAILTLWLAIVILLEHAAGRSARGFAFGGAVAFTTAGLLMLPAIETTFLGEFNTYGLLHPISCFLAAAGLVAVHKAARAMRLRNLSPLILPFGIAALTVVAFLVLAAVQPDVYASIVWGLSWITGIGVQRTTMTIAEARNARFICGGDTAQYSCLQSDFGLAAPLFVFLLLVLVVFVLWRRRRQDILLLIWGFVMYRATTTQIRFSYYVAINVALMLGWLAHQVSLAVGLERPLDEPRPAETRPAAPGTKGRKARKLVETQEGSLWLKVAAVSAVALLILPGNVFALDSGARPGWEYVDNIGPDSDLRLWMDGLDWMRENTPDAGVDLGLVVPRPNPGESYDYPPETYGVLSWWDYGHWIETVARRPPVANPFQQAAPFASLYFTERDPAQAERMLDEWVRGEGPVRYVWIDDAMATGKYGAITVWANSQNESRSRYGAAGSQYFEGRVYRLPDGGVETVNTVGPEYTEAMMGRLYDRDAEGLGHYRLVYEHPDYTGIGSVVDLERGLLCLHDAIPSRGCQINIPGSTILDYREGTLVPLGGTTYAFDLAGVSRLKLFERVEGARLVGTAAPGEQVEAGVRVVVSHPGGTGREFMHVVRTTADAQGNFELRFPYSTGEMLSPAEGGTNAVARTSGPVVVATPSRQASIDVPDRAVLQGDVVQVTF